MGSLQLQDFIVVVTGGGSGIGLATVVELCERGAIVWTPELSPSPPSDLETLIHDGRVHFRGGIDVSSREACTKFMDEVISTSGRLDGLVNNAGIGLLEGSIASDDAFDRMMAVNVKGTFNYATHALRTMQDQKPRGKWNSRGSVVNVSSGAGLIGVSQLAVYCATKHAVIGLTRAWAKDFTQYGIRVNALCPGVTETPAFKARCETEEGFAESVSGAPAHRFADPLEMASVVAFLLGDDSSYLSGQPIAVSGGG